MVKCETRTPRCSCQGCPRDSAPGPWTYKWCLGSGRESGPSFSPELGLCRWSHHARCHYPAGRKIESGWIKIDLILTRSLLTTVWKSLNWVREEKWVQSTLSYFSAVHKLIAVSDVGWRSARQSPGQRQTGGAVIFQMDQPHLGGI